VEHRLGGGVPSDSCFRLLLVCGANLAAVRSVLDRPMAEALALRPQSDLGDAMLRCVEGRISRCSLNLCNAIIHWLLCNHEVLAFSASR